MRDSMISLRFIVLYIDHYEVKLMAIIFVIIWGKLTNCLLYKCVYLFYADMLYISTKSLKKRA